MMMKLDKRWGCVMKAAVMDCYVSKHTLGSHDSSRTAGFTLKSRGKGETNFKRREQETEMGNDNNPLYKVCNRRGKALRQKYIATTPSETAADLCFDGLVRFVPHLKTNEIGFL
jgi:hypothetical protein